MPIVVNRIILFGLYYYEIQLLKQRFGYLMY